MTKQRVLPPAVCGKVSGTLKISVDEIFWLKTSPGPTSVEFQWWGDTELNTFTPLDVNEVPPKQNVDSSVTFTIKTTLELFEAYLVNCGKLTFYVVLEKTKQRIGKTVVKDISQIINQNDYQCYYPIFDGQGTRLGDMHICFVLETKARLSSRQKKTPKRFSQDGEKKGRAATPLDKKNLVTPHKVNVRAPLDSSRDAMISEILSKGQSLRKAMVMSVLADCSSDSIDDVLTARNQSPRPHKKIGKVDQQLLNYLTGQKMSPAEEDEALNILRNISPTNSVIELARPAMKPSRECCVHGNGCGSSEPRTLMSPISPGNQKSENCDAKQTPFEAHCKNRIPPSSPTVKKPGDSSVTEPKTGGVLKKVDCYRVNFKSIKLSPSGMKKINYIPSLKSGCAKGGSAYHTRGTVFMLEYSDSTEYHPEGRAVAKKTSTFLSKKVNYDDITFGQCLTRKLFAPFSCTRLKNSLSHLVIKVSWRFLNQRIPLLLGTCNFPDYWELCGVVTPLKLPILTNSALVAGHLHVNVELGSGGKIFGIDLVGKKEDNIFCVLKEDGMFKDHCDSHELKETPKIPEDSMRQHVECCCHHNDEKTYHCEETYNLLLAKLQQLINSSCTNLRCRRGEVPYDKESQLSSQVIGAGNYPCETNVLECKKRVKGTSRGALADPKSSQSSCCYESAASRDGISFSNLYTPVASNVPSGLPFKNDTYFPKQVKSTPNITLGSKHHGNGHKSCSASCHQLPTCDASVPARSSTDYNEEKVLPRRTYAFESKYFTHEITISIDKISGFPVFMDPKIKGEMDCYVDYVFPSVNVNNEIVVENARSSTEIVMCSDEPKFNYFATHCLTIPSTTTLENGLINMRRQEIAFNVWLRLYQPGPRDHMVAVVFLTVDQLIKMENAFNQNGGNSTIKKELFLPIVIVPTQLTSNYKEMKGNYGHICLTISYKNYPLADHMTHAEKGPKTAAINLSDTRKETKITFDYIGNSDEINSQSTNNDNSNSSSLNGEKKVMVDVALSPMSSLGFMHDPQLKYDLRERFNASDFPYVSPENFGIDLFSAPPCRKTREMSTNTSLEEPVKKLDQKSLLTRATEFLSTTLHGHKMDENEGLEPGIEFVKEKLPIVNTNRCIGNTDGELSRICNPFEKNVFVKSPQSSPTGANKESIFINPSKDGNDVIEESSPCALKVVRADVEVCKMTPKVLEKLSRSEVFKARVEIERAINIPPLLDEESGCKILKKPSTFVSFVAFKDNMKTELKTNIVRENCNPVWNASWEVLLPLKLLYVTDARLKFEVNSFIGQSPQPSAVNEPKERNSVVVGKHVLGDHVGWVDRSRGSGGRSTQQPSLGFVEELRQYTVFVDITVVSAGLPYINGWFSLIQYSRSCGQIKISITPLEDVSQCKELWWKDNCKKKGSRERKASDGSESQNLPFCQKNTTDLLINEKNDSEKVPTDVLARSLQDKLKELEHLTDQIKETFVGINNAPLSYGNRHDEDVLLSGNFAPNDTEEGKKGETRDHQPSFCHRDTLSDETLSKVMNISLNHEGSLLDQMLREDLGNIYPSEFNPYLDSTTANTNVQLPQTTPGQVTSLETEELIETASEEIDRIIRNIRYQHENT